MGLPLDEALQRFRDALAAGEVTPTPEPWLRAAAEAGHREAMHALGEWYLEQLDEEHLEQNPGGERRAHAVAQREALDLGIRWLAGAAEQGDVNAAVTLANVLSRSGPGFQTEAARWHEHAAELGDALSMVRIARIFEQGAGRDADPAAADAWYRRAADAFLQASEQDDAFAPFAMCELAELSLRGSGVAQDSARAVALYERAAARGHHWAMLTLGDLYERGDGVARNRQRAEHWLQRAVGANEEAPFRLPDEVAPGRKRKRPGTPQDPGPERPDDDAV